MTRGQRLCILVPTQPGIVLPPDNADVRLCERRIDIFLPLGDPLTPLPNPVSRIDPIERITSRWLETCYVRSRLDQELHKQRRAHADPKIDYVQALREAR